MSTKIYIDDDGDETVFIRINDEVIAEVGHGPYGWAGMEEIIGIVTEIAEAFGIPLVNRQDIV
jgi:hypothetical protein